MTNEDPQNSATEPDAERWLNSTVVGAGITSALGDICYESTTTVLPGFLAALGLPAAPAMLGLIEGASDAVASFTKLGVGFYSDRVGHRKPLVVFSYGLTAAAQGLYALALGWPLILVGRMIAWLGRGIRGPLRDAILADSITERMRGRAFGFHRAADTLGAIVGPLLGAGVLTLAESYFGAGDPTRPFRVVFWVAIIPGALSVLAFALLVHEKPRAPNRGLGFRSTLGLLPKTFRRYLTAVGIFGLGDFAPTLLILGATELLAPDWGVGRAAQIAAALYLLRNAVYAAVSFPVGALGDRIGHKPVLVVGYFLGAATAGLMAAAFFGDFHRIGMLIAVFVLAGLYIAVEDTLEGAMTADLIAPEIRGTGFGVLATVNGIGDFVASSLIGALWTGVSPTAAFATAAGLMGVGATWLMLARDTASQ
jgi:MFS family permease